jgi:hypothetical protein
VSGCPSACLPCPAVVSIPAGLTVWSGRVRACSRRKDGGQAGRLHGRISMVVVVTVPATAQGRGRARLPFPIPGAAARALFAPRSLVPVQPEAGQCMQLAADRPACHGHSCPVLLATPVPAAPDRTSSAVKTLLLQLQTTEEAAEGRVRWCTS